MGIRVTFTEDPEKSSTLVCMFCGEVFRWSEDTVEAWTEHVRGHDLVTDIEVAE
jgi:hypothetical protein